ncbi:hypothetical protein [Flavobacterium turcicum]|uniref:Uncharacterized protein n=1 Tax=Flavobacterium turcicum TaxID=2764718 RepID=A0ABR7JEF1_9FLAO|nr:hypothetical protein [Flavobacterium turcicum]MBC5862891.1 hypothetical protein [Flavobacterium turcicum]NHL01623.1 hypothetical protein [Flavobacterium turcicum]
MERRQLMSQKDFSKLIIGFLQLNFPEFTRTIKYQDDDSFDCYLKSESGIFSIWIATYNSEITIGIEDPKGETSIHSHINCDQIEDFSSCTVEVKSYIENIKTDKLILYQDKEGKYDWIESSMFEDINGSKKFYWRE